MKKLTEPETKNTVAALAHKKGFPPIYYLLREVDYPTGLEILTNLLQDQAALDRWTQLVTKGLGEFDHRSTLDYWGQLDFWLETNKLVADSEESTTTSRELDLLEKLVQIPCAYDNREREVVLIELMTHIVQKIQTTRNHDYWTRFLSLAEKAQGATQKCLERQTRYMPAETSMWFLKNTDKKFDCSGSISHFGPRVVRHFWRALTLNDHAYPRHHIVWMEILAPSIRFDEVFRMRNEKAVLPPSRDEVEQATIKAAERIAGFATKLNTLVEWLKQSERLLSPKDLKYDLDTCKVTEITFEARTGRAGVWDKPVNKQREIITGDIHRSMVDLGTKFKELGIADSHPKIKVEVPYHDPEPAVRKVPLPVEVIELVTEFP